MKILQLHSFLYPHVGGSENYVLELSKRLKERGHQVLIVTSRLKGDERRQKIEGVDVLRLPGIYLKKVPYFIFSPELLSTLFRLSQKFDIVHSHIPFFFSTNCAALNRIIRPGSKLVLTLHTTKPHPHLTLFKFVSPAYDRTLGRITANRADILIATDEKVKQYAISYGVKAEKIVVIPNGVSVEDFTPVERRDNELFTIGFVGRLVAGKGVKYLLLSASHLYKKRQFCIKIAGDGPEKRSLQKLCKELKLEECVEFLGVLDRNQIPNFLQNLDVLVLPSLSEGLPTVVLEAMASGIAVIATDVGATSTLIFSEDMGILVPPKDTLALSSALENMAESVTKRKKIRENARKRVEQFYSWNIIVRQIEGVYRSIGED